MPSSAVARAVVVGAGMAGLAAASALQGAFDEVIVVERDRLPGEPARRRGVPQGDQLHNLLGAAQVHLEELLPGLLSRLRAQGCGDADVAAETYVFELGQLMPRRSLGLRLMAAHRPVLEHVARHVLLDLGGVRVDHGVVVGLRCEHGRVAGVVVETDGTGEQIEAEVVVDATGAGAAGVRWLSALEFPGPELQRVETDQWYVSTRVQRPNEHLDDPTFWLVFPTPPGTRGGLVSPAGPSVWHVSMNGRSADPPPTTWAEMVAYAETLEDPVLGTLLEKARPIDEPHRFSRITTTWRRFDRLESSVAGFLAIGDAVAALNPLFGQGISVAAWQANLLAAEAPRLRDPTTRAEATVDIQRAFADVVARAWDLGRVVEEWVLGDAPGEADRRARMLALGELLRRDPELHRRYVAVWHLLEPASVLSSPEVLRRLEEQVGAGRRGEGRGRPGEAAP